MVGDRRSERGVLTWSECVDELPAHLQRVHLEIDLEQDVGDGEDGQLAGFGVRHRFAVLFSQGEPLCD